jgi:transposase
VEVIDLPEAEKHCAWGTELRKIGVDAHEKLEIIPMRIFVKRMELVKYACPCCKGHSDDVDAPSVIRAASTPPAILPGGIASAILLAYVFSGKFENHLSYFRLEQQFAQISVTVSRQDMVNWQRKIYEILMPLLALLLQILKTGPELRMDETTVQVMGEEAHVGTHP